MRKAVFQKKFLYKRLVHMEDTDSTKSLYFTSQLRFGLQAFETFLRQKKITLEKALLPIVHSEADYTAPAFWGEELKVYLSLAKIGNRSFTMRTELYSDKFIGTNLIVHVAVDAKTQKPILLPAKLRTLLLTLQGEESDRDLEFRQELS